MPTNIAAWLMAKQTPFEVKPAPYTSPAENEIVVQSGAVAVNPVDWIKQTAGNFIFSWIKYPFVLGSDLAGDVVEVGKNVTRFKVGDRVLGHAVGSDPKRNRAAEGAFQQYTVLLENMAAPIPSSMSYEDAAVLPLGASTAACGLFQKDFLALTYPSATPKPMDRTLLVWGGSTSVGSNAIQLAVAAGYDVITTASPNNFAYVKQLGASRAFDYNDKNVVQDIIHALVGKTIAGALSVGAGSAEACIDVVSACEGNKFVAMATFPISFENQFKRPGINFDFISMVSAFVWKNAVMLSKCRVRNIRRKYIFGSSLMSNEVSTLLYTDFLPSALAEGRYRAVPEPRVLGTGLEHVQTGLDVLKKGVSASKIVISLR